MAQYVPALYPSIARACGISTEPGVEAGAPPVPLTRAASQRLDARVRDLLVSTRASQRCDTRATLLLEDADQGESEGEGEGKGEGDEAPATAPALAMPSESGALTGAATAHAGRPESGALAGNRHGPASLAGDSVALGLGSPKGRGIGFSRAGMIALHMHSRKVQAGKNVLNPTRLEATLLRNQPADKAQEFEDRRLDTREARDERLQQKLRQWKQMSASVG